MCSRLTEALYPPRLAQGGGSDAMFALSGDDPEPTAVAEPTAGFEHVLDRAIERDDAGLKGVSVRWGVAESTLRNWTTRDHTGKKSPPFDRLASEIAPRMNDAEFGDLVTVLCAARSAKRQGDPIARVVAAACVTQNAVAVLGPMLGTLRDVARQIAQLEAAAGEVAHG